ncbi:MAG: HEAT repeat domain-containing protein [bacterium]
MRRIRFFLFLGLTLSFLPPAQAGLSDSDPKNFFALLDQAALVVQARRKSATAPSSAQPFFQYQLREVEVLKGAKGSSPASVLDEALTPKDPELLPPEATCLIFLAALPDFTAYREWRRQGFEYRILGGKSGVVCGSEEALKDAREYLQAEGAARYRVLLKALGATEPRLANDAALALGDLKVSFTPEEAASMARALGERPLADPAKIAGVKALESCGNAACLASLQQLAGAPPSPAKWAALRALQRLGQGATVDRLAEDFRQADDAGKGEVLALLIPQKNAAAAEFANAVLNGPFAAEVKKAAIRKLAENKTPEYEALLLKQLPQGETALRVETILALGRMGSSRAVPFVIPLLDSPDPALRGAAFFMLTDSQDPKAQEYMSQRYTRDHHGVWEQNQHFYQNTGPPRPQ